MALADTKGLDRLSLGLGHEDFDRQIDWCTSGIWRPLRYQVHYFDFLNDSSYPDAWKERAIEGWISANRMASGDGWIPYAVSLRIVNWIKFLLHRRSAVNALVMESLYGQVLWLENNLERHILANHYLKNAKALLFAGLFFDGVDAQRWLKGGRDLFLSETKEQFLADGGHYERSPMYHAIAVEDILDTLNFLECGVVGAEPAYLDALRRYARSALDFYDALLLPDGSMPLFNDAASGVGPTSQELFAYAARIVGYRRTQIPNILTLRSFSASGYYVIRDGSNMMVVDCGEPGPRYQPGHAHCDALSYELAIEGEPVVIDTGVFDYEDNPERRYARSTAAHNTVQVGGAEQSEMWEIFRVGRRIDRVSATLAISERGEAVFEGCHDGFRYVSPGMLHRREVRYARGTWSVVDRIEGGGTREITSRVHLRPGLAPSVDGSTVSIARIDGSAVARLRAQGNVRLHVAEAPYFRSFGEVQKGYVIVMSWLGALPASLSYTLESAST